MNQLINEALQDYVGRRSREVEQALNQTVMALRAYRRRDPDFKAAIGAVAKAEVQHHQSHALDGDVMIGELVDGRVIPDTGPVTTEIRQL